jgi:predicted Zn-dependent peptidase
VKPEKMEAPPTGSERRIFLVDRPKSSQAELRLALFGVEHSSPEYPKLKVANQVLGGGVAGRLFLDVREKRSLAYSTYSRVERVEHGPQPVILSAGTQTAKAGLTLQALLEHAQMMAETGPTEEEARAASRYLSDLFLLRMESVGSLTSMVSGLAIYGLPNEYYDEYRKALASAEPSAVSATAKAVFGASGELIVVAGDAERLATPLSHFGEVVVIDPNKGFKTVKTVPHDPAAKIELDRLEGT